MKNENRFILELCKFQNENKELLLELMHTDLDYPYILGHLLYNRIGGIAYYTLKKHGLLSLVNREFRNTLKTIYESNVEKSKSFIAALADISNLCSTLSVNYALLKGAYLVNLYPLGLRTSNDIDFLVEPSSVTVFSEALKGAGFRQGNIKNEVFVPASRSEIISSRMNRGETVPFAKELSYPQMKYLEIDINFSLGFRPGLDENIVSEFLKKTESLILGNIKTLNNIDFLIHLCAHLYKEATVINWVEMGRDISLYKYCDIYLFISSFLDTAYVEEFCEKAIRLGLQKEVYYTLYYTKELFNFTNRFVDEILEKIKPQSLNFMNQIINPAQEKQYYFNQSYIDWVFCSHRKENLYEIGNGKE